ncbi:MAG TPA: nitroreductase family deazaflavin-dependent oxidoreductase [Candidatus Limnocylindrales bacterium]
MDNATEEVIDSPKGWVASHIKDYVETDGRKGHGWHGVQTLLLTTRGRRSGKLRRTALIYGKDGDAFVVVGSNGGDDKHPLWYLNVRSDDAVTIQVGDRVVEARAREAEGEERERLWRMMAQMFPTYEQFRTKTGRRIPVVVIEPAPQG